MIYYSYQLNNFRTWIQDFGKLLKLKVVAGKIKIPTSMGDGYILGSNINRDISYVVMNFSINDDLVFFQKKSAIYGVCLFFNEITVSDFETIRTPHNAITYKSSVRTNIFVSATNYDLEVTWSKNSKFKKVGIFFSPDFITRCIRRELLLDLLIYSSDRMHLIETEPITFEYRQFLDDIYRADNKSAITPLLRHNRILLLAEKFLSWFLANGGQRKEHNRMMLSGKENDIEALKCVERMLTSNKQKTFPSIKLLAKAAMMSTTRLKIKFKETYSLTLYEYFNRNRHEKAREMLVRGRYSVAEAARHIGYANMGNFTKAFKNHFGVCPKEFLKSRKFRNV
jgi:AraC-like DNA-binding protein